MPSGSGPRSPVELLNPLLVTNNGIEVIVLSSNVFVASLLIILSLKVVAVSLLRLSKDILLFHMI